MSAAAETGLTILQISAEYPHDPGGVGDYTRLLGRALIERGHRVIVLTGKRAGATRAADSEDEPELVEVAGDWSLRTIGPLRREIAGVRPDVVHIQYQTGAYDMRPAINLLPWFLRRLRERPAVAVTMHDLRLPYLLPKAGALRRFVTERLLHDADQIIVTNAEDRRRLDGVGPPDPAIFLARKPLQAAIIPIGSNIAPEPPLDYDRIGWRRGLGIGDGILIAFFGLASPTKGLRELVQALAISPSAHLVVVGGEARSDSERQYVRGVRELVNRLELADWVHFTGYCDPPTVSAHLLAADLAALPFHDGASYRRGSLLAILAHGVPLITTRPQMPLEPPLIDHEHALLVDSPEPSVLAEAIAELSADAALRDGLSANGRALAQQFAWPAISAAHERVYNDLLT